MINKSNLHIYKMICLKFKKKRLSKINTDKGFKRIGFWPQILYALLEKQKGGGLSICLWIWVFKKRRKWKR